MTWFRIDDTWLMHPKVQAAGLKGRALWVAGGIHCAQQLTDGRIDKPLVPVLAAQAGVPAKEARTLVTVGLWHDEGDHYRMHDYHEYQPSRDEYEAKLRKKRDAAVKGNHERWHVARGEVDASCPLCEHPPDPKRIAPAIANGSQDDGSTESTRPVPSPSTCVDPSTTSSNAPPPAAEIEPALVISAAAARLGRADHEAAKASGVSILSHQAYRQQCVERRQREAAERFRPGMTTDELVDALRVPVEARTVPREQSDVVALADRDREAPDVEQDPERRKQIAAAARAEIAASRRSSTSQGAPK